METIRKVWIHLKKILLKLKNIRKIEEDIAKDIWTTVLFEHAEVYRGMFTSLKRSANGEAKKPQRVIAEWYKRTEYNIKDEAVVKLSTETLIPLAENGDTEKIAKAASEILEAAKAAGITQDDSGKLTLDESNTNAYTDWNGEQLYLGDKVTVTNGAWYQNGKILEQGFCNKISE